MTTLRSLAALILLAITASPVSAACINRFTARTERPRQIVTLLTGKLTFQEAHALAEAIRKKQAPPIEWVTAEGKSLAKQFGDLKVLRPMPVSCDGRSSGVVMVATFATSVVPTTKMFVKLNPETTVAFDQQAN